MNNPRKKYTEQWQLAESLLRKLPHDQHISGTTRELYNILTELRVHQSELEAQNTQLRSNYQKLNDERQRLMQDSYDAVNQSLFSARIISETMLHTSSISANGELSHLHYLNT